MSDLIEITKHMQARDHLPDSAKFGDRERWDSVHLELADDVPGLVADVQRLYAENARLAAELAELRIWRAAQTSTGVEMASVLDSLRAELATVNTAYDQLLTLTVDAGDIATAEFARMEAERAVARDALLQINQWATLGEDDVAPPWVADLTARVLRETES